MKLLLNVLTFIFAFMTVFSLYALAIHPKTCEDKCKREAAKFERQGEAFELCYIFECTLPERNYAE